MRSPDREPLQNHSHSRSRSWDRQSPESDRAGRDEAPRDEDHLESLIRRMLEFTLYRIGHDRCDDQRGDNKDNKDNQDQPRSDRNNSRETIDGRTSNGTSNGSDSYRNENEPKSSVARILSDNNELARIVVGQAVQFAVRRYLKSKRQKATKKANSAKQPVQMPPSNSRDAGREGPVDNSRGMQPLGPQPIRTLPPFASPYEPQLYRRDDPPPEPRLRRRHRRDLASEAHRDREPRQDAPLREVPPLVLTPSPPPYPAPYPQPPAPRLPARDATPVYPPVQPTPSPYELPPPRFPYSHHPNYPIHEPHRRRPIYTKPIKPSRPGPADPPTPPISPHGPERLREKEREKERERNRQKERDRKLGRIERSRERVLATAIDDLLVQLRRTDDLVYRTLYRPAVRLERIERRERRYRREHEHLGDREGRHGRCGDCRTLLLQATDLERSLARARAEARAVRDMLESTPDDTRRKRVTVQLPGGPEVAV